MRGAVSLDDGDRGHLRAPSGGTLSAMTSAEARRALIRVLVQRAAARGTITRAMMEYHQSWHAADTGTRSVIAAYLDRAHPELLFILRMPPLTMI